MTRPPVKRTHITRTLRRQIISGKLRPGSLLPSRIDMCKTFNASIHTVQRAVDRLVEDQFVVSKAGLGTYVVDRPPHLAQFALIFPHNPSDNYAVWSRFWQALVSVAGQIERETHHKILPFYGVYGPTDTDDYQRLLNLLRRERLAGLIFASPPFWLEESPQTEFDVPRVAIAGSQYQLMPTVRPDAKSFVHRSLDYLASRGRKRVAALFTESGAGVMADELRAGARSRGMRIEPYWIQTAGLVDVKWACNTTHLLMHPNQRERPDGLIIADDNLVEPAAAGVLASGVRVGEEADIVAHCNFPLPPSSVVPVARLGLDVRQLMNVCIESIDLQRRGKQPPRQTVIQPQFESELSPTVQSIDTGESRTARSKIGRA